MIVEDLETLLDRPICIANDVLDPDVIVLGGRPRRGLAMEPAGILNRRAVPGRSRYNPLQRPFPATA